MYNVSWEAVVAGAELNLTTASTVPCQHGWEYDMGGYHVSVAVEQDWVGVNFVQHLSITIELLSWEITQQNLNPRTFYDQNSIVPISVLPSVLLSFLLTCSQLEKCVI